MLTYVNRIFIILFSFLVAFITMQGGVAKAQKVYATGTITGGIISTGLTVGSPYGITRPGNNILFRGTPTYNLLLLELPTDNDNNFYYSGSIKTTAGASTGVGSSTILGQNETLPAKVSANKGLEALIPVAGAHSFIQFRYGTDRPAKTTSYLKLKEKPIRNSTVDVAAFGLLGLAANKIVVGEVYSGAREPQNYPGSLIFPTAPAVASQNVGTALGNTLTPTKTDLVIDKNGEWYAAVTPTATGAYNSVRLTAQFPNDLNVVSLANSVEFNVYNAFTDPGAACNFRPTYTNEGEASGISLDVGAVISLLDLAEIVKNPTRAIDDNLDSYSSISSGIANVGVLNTVSQTFYFDHKAAATDNLRLQLGLKTSLIDLDLLSLNGIRIKAYNGGSSAPVYNKGLYEVAQLLSLNLLNLVTINGTTHKKLDLTFQPGVAFDRVELVFDQGLLGVGVLGDAMRIYDVSMAPALPIITVQPSDLASTNICEGSSASFSVTASTTGGGSVTGYQWQYLDGNHWISAPSGSTSALNIASAPLSLDKTWYRVVVTGGDPGCPQQIVSNEVQLTVKPAPSIIPEPSTFICKGVTNCNIPYTSALESPTSYSITWNTAAATAGMLSVTDEAITPDELLVVIPATVPAGIYEGSITVKNSAGCTAVPKPFSIEVRAKPASPIVVVTSNQ